MGVLLNEGIGDTIRVSLTPRPGGDRREEVYAACELLQALGLRAASLRGLGPRLRAAAPDVEAASRGFSRLSRRLAAAASRSQRDRHSRLAAAAASLSHLDPTQVLARGYAIVRAADGKVVRSGSGLARGDALDVSFAEGGASVTVERPR